MHFLVTGGAGFIGSHLVDKLFLQGHDVTVIDNFSTGKAENLPNHKNELNIVKKDIRNLDEVFSIPGEFDGIFHLAALVSVTESIQDPEKSFATNSCGTFHMLEFARRKRIPRFVLASSAAVYGNAEKMPISENDQLNPFSPYGLEKMHGEWLCKMYSMNYGLKTMALRLFNVYGSRQDPNSPYAGVIPIFTKLLRAGRNGMIYGDGLQTRDFIFVDDVADAMIASMSDKKGKNYEVFNVATGHSISLLDLYKLICEIIKVEYKPEFQDARTGDILHSLADISQIQKHLDFQPAYSLKEGLAELIG